jgi:hypothetical protein
MSRWYQPPAAPGASVTLGSYLASRLGEVHHQLFSYLHIVPQIPALYLHRGIQDNAKALTARDVPALGDLHVPRLGQSSGI